MVEAEEDHKIQEGGLGTPADVVEENQAVEDTPMDTLVGDHETRDEHEPRCGNSLFGYGFAQSINQSSVMIYVIQMER